MPESNLISNSLSCIYGDSMGGVWIGTFNNGLLYYYQHQLKFNLYYSKGQINGISSNYVTSFASDKRNNIWIGAGEEGLLYFDRSKRSFKKINPNLKPFTTSAELKENFYILSLHLTPDEKHLLMVDCRGKLLSIDKIQWWRKDKDGWPIEMIIGRPFANFVRLIFQNIRKVTG